MYGQNITPTSSPSYQPKSFYTAQQNYQLNPYSNPYPYPQPVQIVPIKVPIYKRKRFIIPMAIVLLVVVIFISVFIVGIFVQPDDDVWSDSLSDD